MRRTPDATSRPPRPPTRLNPSAMKRVDTRNDDSGESRSGDSLPPSRFRPSGGSIRLRALGRTGRVAGAGTHVQPALTHGDLDRVPLAVALVRHGVANGVLLVQLARQLRRRLVEILEAL